jgi:hypothetical protein
MILSIILNTLFVLNGVSWLNSIAVHILFKKYNPIASFTKDTVIQQYTYSLIMTLGSMFIIKLIY